MFTEKSVNGIGRLIKLGSKTKVLPVDWNNKTRRAEVGSRKQRFIMAMVMIYMYLEAAYQAYRLVVGHMDKSVPLKKYMKLVELFATRLTALMVQTIAFVYDEDIKYFTNQLLNMNARFIEIYGHNHIRDPCAKVYTFWYWFVTIHPIVAAAVYAKDNTDDRYWHGALLPTGIQPFFVPLFILVEYWLGFFCELGCASMGCVMLAYFKSTPVWMNELATMVRKNKATCEQVTNLFRALLILNRAFNNALSLLMTTGTFALLADIVITLTCSLRLTPAMGLPGLPFPIASVAFILCVECAVRPAANLTTPSTDFLAAYSEVVSVRSFGNKRRGNVGNMEKERKKFMKIKKRFKAEMCTAASGSTVNVLENRSVHPMPKTSNSRWNETLSKALGQRKNFASHLEAKRGCEGCNRASHEDCIQVLGTDEVGMPPVVSSEKQRSKILAATAKSMYPTVVKCFIFFEFEHSTIFNFYSTVLDQTISALLVT